MGQDPEQLRRDIENTRAEMSGTLEAIGDRVSPGRMAERSKNRVVVGAQSIRERVMGVASDTQHRVMGVASDTQHRVSDKVSGTGEALHHAPEAMVERAQGAPMIAGALAFGVGFLVAAAFPPSEKEKQMSAKVMESIEPVKQQVVESAHEMASNLKEPAMEAANTLKDAASEGVQSVTSTAKDAAADTKQQATQSVDAVKSGDAASY